MRKISSFHRSMKNCFQGTATLYAVVCVHICSELHCTAERMLHYTHCVTTHKYLASLLRTLFKKKFIYLFLFLAALGLHCSARASLAVASHAVASIVAEHRL